MCDLTGVPWRAVSSEAFQGEAAARRSLRARLRGGPLVRAIARWDVRVFRLVRKRLASTRATPHVRRFSALGEHAAGWLVLGGCGLALERGERRRAWRRGLWAVATAYLLNTALKNVARRRRPSQEDLPALMATPTQLSFPSAHSASSFAAAAAYAPVLPSGPLVATAGAMAFSRVWLGVHYPSDVLVGAGLGTAVGRTLRCR